MEQNTNQMSSEEIDVVGSMELDANDWPDAQELTATQDEDNERNEEELLPHVADMNYLFNSCSVVIPNKILLH